MQTPLEIAAGIGVVVGLLLGIIALGVSLLVFAFQYPVVAGAIVAAWVGWSLFYCWWKDLW